MRRFKNCKRRFSIHMNIVQMNTRITCTVLCKRHCRIKGMRKFECLTSAQRKYLETHKQYSTELNAWVCYTIVSVCWSSLPSSLFFFFFLFHGKGKNLRFNIRNFLHMKLHIRNENIIMHVEWILAKYYIQSWCEQWIFARIEFPQAITLGLFITQAHIRYSLSVTYQNIFRNDILSTDLHLYIVRCTYGTHSEHNLYDEILVVDYPNFLWFSLFPDSDLWWWLLCVIRNALVYPYPQPALIYMCKIEQLRNVLIPDIVNWWWKLYWLNGEAISNTNRFYE